jgi:hypothetical protein
MLNVFERVRPTECAMQSMRRSIQSNLDVHRRGVLYLRWALE